MQSPALLRTVERKGGYNGIEIVTAFDNDMKASRHKPGRGGQRCAACIFKHITGSKNGLLTDKAIAYHFMGFAPDIGYFPVPGENLDGLISDVFNLHMIGPGKPPVGRFGLVLKIFRVDRNGDTACCLFIHRFCWHDLRYVLCAGLAINSGFWALMALQGLFYHKDRLFKPEFSWTPPIIRKYIWKRVRAC